MTNDEIIAVVAAHKAGNQIERGVANGFWEVDSNPEWAFDVYNYRAKREPREWWIIPSAVERVWAGGCVVSPQRPEPSDPEWRNFIHVREVLP